MARLDFVDKNQIRVPPPLENPGARDLTGFENL